MQYKGILSSKKINNTGKVSSAEMCLIHCWEGLWMTFILGRTNGCESGLAVRFYACASFFKKTD